MFSCSGLASFLFGICSFDVSSLSDAAGSTSSKCITDRVTNILHEHLLNTGSYISLKEYCDFNCIINT